MNTACELRLEPDTFCEESKVVGGQVSLYMGEFAPCVIYFKNSSSDIFVRIGITVWHTMCMSGFSLSQ